MRLVLHHKLVDQDTGSIPGRVDRIEQPDRIEVGLGRTEAAGHRQVVVVVVDHKHAGSGRLDRQYPAEGDIPDFVGRREDNLLVPDRSIHLQT
jgi:hypothetical protein